MHPLYILLLAEFVKPLYQKMIFFRCFFTFFVVGYAFLGIFGASFRWKAFLGIFSASFRWKAFLETNAIDTEMVKILLFMSFRLATLFNLAVLGSHFDIHLVFAKC